MESLLLGAGRGGGDEVVARCSALLEGKQDPRPQGSTRLALELTHALASLLSEPRGAQGPKLYLQAFHANKAETARLIRSRQAQLLPRIVDAFLERLSLQTLGDETEAEQEGGTEALHPEEASKYLHFLSAIAPGDTQARAGTENTAAHWLLPERRACLLVGRAAALFSVGGRAAEMCRDLGEAFGTHPATARLQFQQLFSDRGAEASACSQLRQQAERGLCEYREAVLGRPDLRSSKGVELLDPVIAGLQALCHLEPGGGSRELRVRLADCLLLRGQFREALSICGQLAAVAPAQQSYQNTVQVLQGFARFLSGDQQGALEDFQAVVEHSAPHPSSCVRALCGRGLLRMLADSHYLAALDYMTASRLHPQETALTVRCLIPWNLRGLLFTVLLEQGRAMLEGAGRGSSQGGRSPSPIPEQQQQQQQRDQSPSRLPERDCCSSHKEGEALLEYLRFVSSPKFGILFHFQNTVINAPTCWSREQTLPIHLLLPLPLSMEGLIVPSAQLLKKLTQCGHTSCLLPLLAVAGTADRALLQEQCHTAAMRILEGPKADLSIREAVSYLTISIIASGGVAEDSLLARARCYALLGQRKTAIFDFNAILKERSEHVQALCGRGFTYLTLNQQKECTQDILTALQVDAAAVTQDILSLKEKASKLICDWLHQHCRTGLYEITAANAVPCREELLKEAFLIGGALMKIDCRDPRWHLLYIDTLLARGALQAAAAHLRQIFGQEPREAVAQARWGVVEAWQRNATGAARGLSEIAEREASTLSFLLALLSAQHRKHLAQAAAEEAGCASERGQWEQALALLTVAVRAGGEAAKPLHLRQRAACLARLGLHERAVSDLQLVVRSHAGSGQDPRAWAGDLCRRGHSLVLSSREESALEDFARALDLHRSQALAYIEAGLGRARLAESFQQAALRHFGQQQLSEAWRLVDYGLRVDESHAELRRLKARIKREAAGSCIVN
ncbi:TTC34 protein, partial [Atractosteus spatula]|nr:TTC34 protein [Atractosteus spatula]